jgi:drug/metabolite transporter (DMT)-like permease
VSRSDEIVTNLRSGTVSGFVAIILWSTTVAFARSLAEQLGPLTAAAAVYGVSGVIAVARLLVSRHKMRRIRQFPRTYLVGCGALFVIYMLVLFLAIGLAEGREQVLEVGLLNYLWPALTILLSLVLLKNRAGLLLLPGTLLALCGIFLVVTQGAHISWHSFSRNLAGNPAAYSLGLSAAVSWALYSILTRRWVHGKTEGAVDLFLPVTGMVLAIICCFVAEPRAWSFRAVAEATFLGAATYLAYGLWDTAMRRGNVVVVAAGSYLTPLLSTLVSSLYLEVAAKPSLWVGCGMLVSGSLLSWISISETGPARFAHHHDSADADDPRP